MQHRAKAVNPDVTAEYLDKIQKALDDYLETKCAAFARFFLAHVPHSATLGGEASPAHIAIYLDDTRPGNVLHAGPKRAYYAVYRTLL